MIQVRVHRGLEDHAHERDQVLEEILGDAALRLRGTLDAHARGRPLDDYVELTVDIDERRLEPAVVRLVDRLAAALRLKRIGDFSLNLSDGTTIVCPKGLAIQVSWPSMCSGELASRLAEELGAARGR